MILLLFSRRAQRPGTLISREQSDASVGPIRQDSRRLSEFLGESAVRGDALHHELKDILLALGEGVGVSRLGTVPLRPSELFEQACGLLKASNLEQRPWAAMAAPAHWRYRVPRCWSRFFSPRSYCITS